MIIVKVDTTMMYNYMKKNVVKSKSNFVEKLLQKNFNNFNVLKLSILFIHKGNYYYYFFTK